MKSENTEIAHTETKQTSQASRHRACVVKDEKKMKFRNHRKKTCAEVFLCFKVKSKNRKIWIC